MTDHDAIIFIQEIISKYKPNVIQKYLYKNKELDNFLNSKYPKLSNSKHSIMEKCYWLMNGLINFPLCKTCGKENELFISYFRGYRDYCSRKCTANSNIVRSKIINTNIKKYGYSSAMCSDVVRKKQIQTMLSRYGVEYACKLDRFILKSKNTCFRRYGVEHQMKSNVIKDNVKKTLLSKYGESSVFHIQQVKDKIKETIIKKYGSYKNMYNIIHIKFNTTILNRYGSYSSYYKIFKQKSKDSILEKYGSFIQYYRNINEKRKKTCLNIFGSVSPFGNISVRKKCLNTFINKYGTINISSVPSVRKKYKDTCFLRYGVDNSSKDPIIRNKIKDISNLRETINKRILTNNIKFGVDYPIQRSDIRRGYQQKYFYDGKYFDSSYEILYYQYLMDNNITFEYKPNIYFKYYYNNIEHNYQPDFFVFGCYIEIKGKHFFKNDTLINPYDSSLNKLYSKKYECMLKNNVIILTEDDFDLNDIKENILYIRKNFKRKVSNDQFGGN